MQTACQNQVKQKNGFAPKQMSFNKKNEQNMRVPVFQRFRIFLAKILYSIANLIVGKCSHEFHESLHQQLKEKLANSFSVEEAKDSQEDIVLLKNALVFNESKESVIFGGEDRYQKHFDILIKGRLGHLLQRENLEPREQEELKNILKLFEDSIIFVPSASKNTGTDNCFIEENK